MRRDVATRAALHGLGWRVADVWECTVKGRMRWPLEKVLGECVAFLEGDEPYRSIGGVSTVAVTAAA